jgi:pilus assembly protein CpaD
MARPEKDNMIMKNIGYPVALLVLALAAGSAQAAEKRSWGSKNPTLYSKRQPVVQRTDYVIDLSTAGSTLPASERGRLASWFESLEVGYGDRIFLDGGDYGDGGARQDVAEVAADYGLLLSDGAPITTGAVEPGSVRVIVTRTTASVPGCPSWGSQKTGASMSTSSNYGCAVNSNIAAMIADPNDLVLGQTGTMDGREGAGVRAIETYRKKAPTGAGNLKPAGGN